MVPILGRHLVRDAASGDNSRVMLARWPVVTKLAVSLVPVLKYSPARFIIFLDLLAQLLVRVLPLDIDAIP